MNFIKSNNNKSIKKCFLRPCWFWRGVDRSIFFTTVQIEAAWLQFYQGYNHGFEFSWASCYRL